MEGQAKCKILVPRLCLGIHAVDAPASICVTASADAG